MRIITLVDFSEFPDFSHRFTADIEVIQIAPGDSVPADLSADVLLTYGEASENLATLLQPEHGIRWVHVVGTGVDGFPLELVGEQLVTCSRGANAVEIAEWVMAMLLSDAKRLPEAWINEPAPQWGEFPLEQLHGRTLGIIGLGGVGKAVAKRALSFDMRVKALVRSPQSRLVEGVELFGELNELLPELDHLVLAAPSTPSTYHLINGECLQWVKPGLHLINIARGKLVDQEALRAALDDGRVRRASLDVMEPEPIPAGHWLLSHPSVRVSPHISWSSPEAMSGLMESFFENLERFKKGEELLNKVNMAKGY